MMVRHHKKSERVKAHLNACIPFCVAPSQMLLRQMFGFIHSKLRNRLSETSVEKLVYIKNNNYHLNTIQTKQRWLEATNSPDEDMSIEESDDNQERAHTDQGNEVNEETKQLEYSLTL
jgi:hypothetical protein